MIAIQLYFLYQEIIFRIHNLTQLHIYYGQLHVSANICICQIWQTNLHYTLTFTFIFKSFIQLSDDNPNRGRNM